MKSAAKFKTRRSEASDAARRAPGWSVAEAFVRVSAAVLLVAVVVVVAYRPVLDCGALSFDDDQYLVNNALVRNPSLAHAGRFMAEVLTPSTVQGYYQPLTMISLMLDAARGGTPANLRPFHETSLALHVANTGLLIVLLYVLFGRLAPAAALGLLFGLHPLTVEPIVWLGDRKTTLAAFFALWAMLAYVLYARRRGRWLYVLCMVAYVLALLSKPTTTFLPSALLLMDFWPLRRLSWRTVLEKVPFGVISAASAVVTVVSQARTASIAAPGSSTNMPLFVKFCHNIVFYMYKMFWPTPLTSLYPKPDPMSLANPMLLVMAAALVAIIIGLAVSLKWTRSLATGWLMFLCMIFPTLGGIGFTGVIAADKYVYLPAVGVVMALCYLVNQGLDRVRAHWGGLTAHASLWGVVIVLAGMEIAGIRNYLPAWRDSETVERYMADLAPRWPMIHYNLGITLSEAGKAEAAVESFNRALALDPQYAAAHNNLGNTLVGLNRPQEAALHLQRALELNPRLKDARENLANVQAMLGQYDAAFAGYEELLRTRPDAPDLNRNYGCALQMAGRNAQAVPRLMRAVDLGAGDARVFNRLGLALAGLGRSADALASFRRAAQLAPGWDEPIQNAARIAASSPAQ